MLGVARAGGELLVADVREELRLAGADDLPGTGCRARIGRIALAHAVRELHLGRVDVGHGDVAKSVVGVGHVDRAPIREITHAQVRDGGQRALQIQRRIERRAHVGQEAHPSQRGALVVDLARDAHDRRAAVRLGNQAPARLEPVRAAVGPDDAQVARARGAVVRRRHDRRAQGGAVGGMHELEEPLEARRRLAGAGERGHRP